MSRFFIYGEYVPIAEKKKRAERRIEELKKSDPDLAPIIVEGRKITNTWWGTAWCKNLESYADYSNRIERGRSYARNSFVVDLKIGEGTIIGKVLGSRLYTVEIKIDVLSHSNKENIINTVGRRIDSMADLVEGKFPKDFEELFLTQEKGLFPSPKEIDLDCDCPDWADMCKHVAAVLYGVGVRLDEDPLLFFKLRGVDVNSFIKASIDEKLSHMMKNVGYTTDRVLKDVDLVELFGL
ncbi:MAG: SWIM zinc finger family protein [Defluviitaleaceae bacterium]|nr:SWIM zinc finger family protein [Defluviitaleaceae bacterium]